jgi:glycerol-3-phosphate acyltransferase PlsY
MLVLAYFIGSIPFGKIVVQLKAKKNIQKLGSGNIGATNVGRAIGQNWGILVFFLDFLKGFIVTFLGVWLFANLNQALLLGLAALVGHVFPIYLGFKGGKGMATTTGILFVVVYPVIIVTGFFHLLVLSQTKTMSIASFCSIALCLLLCWLIAPVEIFYFNLIFSALIIFSHRDNIQRLLAGKEFKLKH